MGRERWRTIAGYSKCYQVSDHGRIRCMRREVCTKKGLCKVWPQKIMRQYAHYKGHLTVYLRRPGEKKKKFFVHRLVAVAFVENPQDLPVVDHHDENKANNHHSNLLWTTAAENTRKHYALQKEEPGSDMPF